MRRVTISDVAERAGVSKSTVSHVINATRFVNHDTRQRVLEAINTLGYRPSTIARSMVSQHTRTVGLLISDVGNPFYSEVILGVDDVALANGYSVFLGNTSYDLERGMRLLISLVDRLVDGLLLMSSSLTVEMLQEAARHNIPTVVLDWGTPGVELSAVTITIDFESGIDQAVHHLVELGHRRIAHVSGPLDLWTARLRRDAFLTALPRHGLDPAEALIIPGDLRIEGGQKAIPQLLAARPRPTAVLAANDLTALGLLWAARAAGLNLPQELSVIGVDDIALASKVTPALTTISLPRYEIGRLAMETLLKLLREPATAPARHQVATRLVVRASTAAPSEGV